MSKAKKSKISPLVWFTGIGLVLVPTLSIAAIRAKSEYNALKSLDYSINKLRFRLLNLDTSRMEADLLLKNGGDVPITVDKITLNIIHQGQNIAGISNSAPITITKQTETIHTIFTDLKNGNVADFFGRVLAGSNTNVTVSGTVDYRTYTTGTVVTLPVSQQIDVKEIARDYLSQLAAGKVNSLATTLQNLLNKNNVRI